LLKLFQEGQPANQTSLHANLEHVIRAVQEELTKPYSNDADRQVDNLAYRKLLEFGLQVLSIQIVNLQFQPVEEQRLESIWETTWLEKTRQEKERITQQQAQDKAAQTVQARVQYVRATTGPLAKLIKGYGYLVDRLLTLKEAASYLVYGTLNGENLTPESKAALQEILQEIEEG
jgi:enoyl reductase-like protein